MKKKFIRKLVSAALAGITTVGILGGCGNSAASNSSSETGTVSGTDSTASAQTQSDTTSDEEVIIRVAFTTAWGDLDPYYTTSGTMYESVVYDKIFDKLAFTSDAGNTITPRAAKSWESADDGKAIIFHLDENATWHDGEKVTADDWVFTLQLLSDPEVLFSTRGPAALIAGTDDSGVETSENSIGAEAIDDYTLKITFKNEIAPEEFLIRQNRYYLVLPKHILENVAPADVLTADYWNAPIGSGPAVFESQVIGSELVFTPNEKFELGNGNWNKLIFSVVDSSNSLQALISGDIDFIALGNITSADNKLVAEAGGLTVQKSEVASGFTEIILNNNNISDPRIRLALHYALEKDTLIEIASKDTGIKAYQSQLPGSVYYDDTLGFERDLEKAKELLAEAGYDGTTYKLAIGSSRESLAAVLQQEWAEAGINVEIIVVDVATMFSGLSDGTYDIGISGHTATASPVWFTENSGTASSIDPKYDEYVNKINATIDVTKKVELVKEYSKYILDNAPYIPICHSYNYNTISPNIDGVDYSGAGLCNDNIWNWNKK